MWQRYMTVLLLQKFSRWKIWDFIKRLSGECCGRRGNNSWYAKRIAINPSGGLKGCGHPVGATGVKQIVEIVEQLRGAAGKRQVANANIGLAHNVGGSGATAVVHILGKL